MHAKNQAACRREEKERKNAQARKIATSRLFGVHLAACCQDNSANSLWPWDVLASSWTPLRFYNAPAYALATPVSSDHEPPAVGPDSSE